MDLTSKLLHFFIPRSSNNHRAKALHIDTLLVYFLVFSLVNLSLRLGFHAIPDVLGFATDINVQRLFELTNQKRSEAGLSQLAMNEKLSQAAAGKARDMFSNNYWAHFSPQGKSPWDFIVGAGYTYTLAGENLAKNFNDSGGVVDAWMNSPSHRENLLKPGYKEIGFAVVNGTLNGEETTLVVQMFGATTKTEQITKDVQPTQNLKALKTAEIKPTAVPAMINTPTPTNTIQFALNMPTNNNPPVEVPTVSEPISSQGTVFSSVSLSPVINLATITRLIVYVFNGALIGVLALDAWIAQKKHVVRAAGHNIAHIAFFSAILLGTLFMTRGALL